jgi:hypothetical protein
MSWFCAVLLIATAETILTCFPERWGHHKEDPPSLRECIHERLSNAADDEVGSVYDPAILPNYESVLIDIF